MRKLICLFVVMFICGSAYGSSDVINGLVVEDSVVYDELGNQYYTKKLYPQGISQYALNLHIIQTNDIPPETRLAFVNDGVNIPINDTGLYNDTIPAVYVHGDFIIGDILALERNPMRYFKRVETGLPAGAVTTLYSSKHSAKDTDGGAFIQYAPLDSGGWNDGYINLTAFGKGQGALANTVFMRARKSEDAIEEIASFNGRNKISAGQTTMSLMIHDGNVLRFERVFIGAPNSGGAGRRALTINN